MITNDFGVFPARKMGGTPFLLEGFFREKSQSNCWMMTGDASGKPPMDHWIPTGKLDRHGKHSVAVMANLLRSCTKHGDD